jgi:hypothetical protein
MKKPAQLDPNLYYFCRAQKNPNMAKIRHCCAGKGCPHLKTRPRKNRLVQITAPESANQSFS